MTLNLLKVKAKERKHQRSRKKYTLDGLPELSQQLKEEHHVSQLFLDKELTVKDNLSQNVDDKSDGEDDKKEDDDAVAADNQGDQLMFTDVTDKLKRSKRNKTTPNQY